MFTEWLYRSYLNLNDEEQVIQVSRNTMVTVPGPTMEHVPFKSTLVTFDLIRYPDFSTIRRLYPVTSS